MKERKAGERMRKRNHVIPVRLNAKELRLLDEQVKRSGLSREEFLRSLIVGAEVRAKPCEHHADLLRKVAGLCQPVGPCGQCSRPCGNGECPGNAEDFKRSMADRERGMVMPYGIYQHHTCPPSG